MKKIEATTLEEAYSKASTELGCSVSQLEVEVIQYPTKGILGLFKKPAIIVATAKNAPAVKEKEQPIYKHEEPDEVDSYELELDDKYYEQKDDYVDEDGEFYDLTTEQCATEVKEKINELFKSICYNIDEIDVKVYDDNTLLVEFSGADSALMIGKEGYRYKALSYMLYNWVSAEYGMQLRLEIAEFLKNQEESISRYLISVCESVDMDGRAQTKVLDGVLVQIALRQLRDRYPDKYVAIRSTYDGGKFIIINSYHEFR